KFYLVKDVEPNKYKFCALATPLSSVGLASSGDPVTRIKEYWPISREQLNASNIAILFPQPGGKIYDGLLSPEVIQTCFKINFEQMACKIFGEDLLQGYTMAALILALSSENVSMRRIAAKKISELTLNEIISSGLNIQSLLTNLGHEDFYIRKYAVMTI